MGFAVGVVGSARDWAPVTLFLWSWALSREAKNKNRKQPKADYSPTSAVNSQQLERWAPPNLGVCVRGEELSLQVRGLSIKTRKCPMKKIKTAVSS